VRYSRLISGLSYKTAFSNELLISIFSVVADEAQLTKFVHEKAHANRVVPVISVTFLG
jgi:hypothetical protein